MGHIKVHTLTQRNPDHEQEEMSMITASEYEDIQDSTKLISQKALYEKEVNEALAGLDAEGFLWGEDMYDVRIILYEGKLKDFPGYRSFQPYLINVAVVMIDLQSDPLYKYMIVRYDRETDDVYIPEANFNAFWKRIRPCVSLGIEIQKEQGYDLQIEKPEDIVDLSHLKRRRSEAVIKHGELVYIPIYTSQNELMLIGKKQSALDNPKNLFFYSKVESVFHDKDCDSVKRIKPEYFRASETAPESFHSCMKCRRKLCIRVACSPNVKQMAPLSQAFSEYGIKDSQLERYVLNYGLKFKCERDDELIVSGKEDSWIIKGMKDGKLSLWHNNYVVTGEKERYITQGFHDQGLEVKNFNFLMEYINNYTYEKHLKAKEIKEKTEENVACEEVQVVKEQSVELQAVSEQEQQLNKVTKKNIVACLKYFISKLVKI